KREGKILFRKLKVAGTGGQCLMGPPEYRDGEYPYLLYNLGGCLMNLITSVLFFCLYLLLRNIPVLNTVLLCLVVCGIFYALLNGIPMQTKDVPNDGYNALRTGDSQEAKKSFWTQLKISEYNAEGKRMSDMPEELFFLPSDSNKTNAVVNSSAVFFENRLMSSRNYCDANIVCHQFLEGDYNLPGIHWNVLQCDRITTDILLENGKCTREGLMSKEAQDYFKKLQESLTVLRTKYIVSLFLGKDEKETDSYLQKFEKVAAHYPNEEDVLDERGLMKLLKEKLAAKTDQN
ncbi:MAG: hypothetical protein IJ091_03355, partial [Oscillospiraceae bacterium]|nr:hypothetical protein [Oscillospiraceae bacterium]